MGLHEFEDIKVAQKVLKRKVDKAAVSGILFFEARRQRPSLRAVALFLVVNSDPLQKQY